jgi:hypothetical protein
MARRRFRLRNGRNFNREKRLALCSSGKSIMLKNCHGLLSRTVVRLRAVETVRANLAPWRVAAVSLLEAQSPLKNVVHGWMRT